MTPITLTLSSGNILAIYPRMTAGEMVIGLIVLILIVIQLFDLVIHHA